LRKARALKEEGKHFFFEKKKQKTFDYGEPVQLDGRYWRGFGHPR
jgi:hypothetical protein